MQYIPNHGKNANDRTINSALDFQHIDIFGTKRGKA